MRRDQIGKSNENLTAHLFVPDQRILLRETTVTETQKTWRFEIEQRSLYVLGNIVMRIEPTTTKPENVVQNISTLS